MSSLTRDPIDVAAVIAGVGSAADGGIAVFIGVVRDTQDGRAVDHLEYEAHEPMAEAHIARLEAEARARWGLGGIAIAHRLGTLAIGEVAVVVAVAAVHRDPALEACRWLIDTLKAEVPIFKKEWYQDGAAWVGDAS